ncbi:phosphoribosylformylglycinamidine synthase subunit PurQ [Clostridium sp. 19966]|uniref:DJ-1/PfpI family protein n=1 Tax=Clostridium sp. 19966 TaxID=2768166 RepID=UPI0028DF32C1|nr:DJ-1/PfpI family protein [Clostridium sp. 19966]MDT8717739.1 phosphoribosylformylglycinamidine synthase subunit PurQ [Clostridium sp. 19966]
MNICVFYYDGFCEFEVVLALNGFRDSFFSAALENRIYISEENQKYLPDKTIQELKPEDIDLFIIPGGDPVQLYGNAVLKEFISKLNEKNKFIAGICGGAELMAYYGLLDYKRANGDSEGFRVNENNKHIYEKIFIAQEDVVRDGNCITAIGQAYAEFAIELHKLMKVYEDAKEAKEAYNWLKNVKSAE